MWNREEDENLIDFIRKINVINKSGVWHKINKIKGFSYIVLQKKQMAVGGKLYIVCPQIICVCHIF